MIHVRPPSEKRKKMSEKSEKVLNTDGRLKGEEGGKRFMASWIWMDK